MNIGAKNLDVYPPTVLHIRDAHATAPTKFMIRWLDTMWMPGKRILAGYSPLYINVQHHMRVGLWAGLFSARRGHDKSIFTPRQWINTYGRIFCRILKDFFTSCHSNELNLIIRNMEASPLVWNSYLQTKASGQPDAITGNCPGLKKTLIERNKFYLKTHGVAPESIAHTYGVDELGASYLCMDSRNKKHTDIGCEQYLKELGPEIQFLNCHHYTRNWGTVNNNLVGLSINKYRDLNGLPQTSIQHNPQDIDKKIKFIGDYITTLSWVKQLNTQKPNLNVKRAFDNYFALRVDADYKFFAGRAGGWCRYLRARQMNDNSQTLANSINPINNAPVFQILRNNFDYMSEISYTLFRYLIDLCLIKIINAYVKSYQYDQTTGSGMHQTIDPKKPVYLAHIFKEMEDDVHNKIYPGQPTLGKYLARMAPTIIWQLSNCHNMEALSQRLSIYGFEFYNSLNVLNQIDSKVTSFLETPINGIIPLNLLGEYYRHMSNHWWMYRPIKQSIHEIRDSTLRKDLTSLIDYHLEEMHYQSSVCPPLQPGTPAPNLKC